jgi:hypothetical protein
MEVNKSLISFNETKIKMSEHALITDQSNNFIKSTDHLGRTVSKFTASDDRLVIAVPVFLFIHISMGPVFIH